MNTDSQPSIRLATSADVPAILAITDAAYTHYIERIGRKPQPMTTDYAEMITNHHIWLLCPADQIVGLLAEIREPDHLLIYSVAVDPQYQGRGYGHQLLDWAEQIARQADYTLIKLYTNAKMTENIARYQRIGYVETSRESFNGSTRVNMEKSLAR
jgi:ribosomal protein S18 acetylase RimI-like enzyme